MKIFNFLHIVTVILLATFYLAAQESAAQGTYAKTPADYEGPFYPVTKQQDEDNDLVRVKGQTGIARGDLLDLSGVVIDSTGKPQKGITIEIWQTDPQGRYRHPGDSTPGARDPNFQYWGRTTTADDGSFFFKTIIPGAYHPRPAHIHFKVWREGKVILTSQIYFRQPAENARRPSMTEQIHLQTADLTPIKKGAFEAFFRIVL